VGAHTIAVTEGGTELSLALHVLDSADSLGATDPLDLYLTDALLLSPVGGTNGSLGGFAVYGVTLREAGQQLQGLWHVTVVPTTGVLLPLRYSLRLTLEPLRKSGTPASASWGAADAAYGAATHTYSMPVSATSLVHAVSLLRNGPPLFLSISLVRTNDSATLVIGQLDAPLDGVSLDSVQVLVAVAPRGLYSGNVYALSSASASAHFAEPAAIAALAALLGTDKLYANASDADPSGG
ncbi:hypothetical protein T492DRAFT_884061, partial [Pavlovales sp. CCMP2436]